MSSGDASAVASSARGERLLGLDAVRGFALLGITLVNMAFFAHPSALMYAFGGDSAAPWWDRAASLGVSVFCEAKFFPLFSLLFGMGMAIMLMGGASRGGAGGGASGGAGGGQVNAAFVWRYLRRLVCLGVIGLLHAWFIWYGDILFLYAVVGVGLLLFSWAPARGLLIGGAVLVGLGALVTAVLTMLGGGGMGEIDATLPQSLAEMPPLQRYFEGWTYEGGKYMLATWASAESEVFSGGPYWSAVAMRMLLWGGGLVAGVMGFGWTVLGMFFLGAGLLKAGFFAPERREARRWLVRMGLVVGLPLAIGGGALMHFGGQHMAAVGLGLMAGMLAGPLLALMWASLFAGWAERPGPMATRVLGVLA
ncbi:MAG: hypothetical protein MUE97_01645, partial [Phycisphaerales bacterium]|nr:hypothetical protein [Phycisphaerales bacterium]